MGMDIYGINPVRRGDDPKRPDNMWENKEPQPTRKEIDQYLEQKNAYEEKNAGIYFRNNVWWWRPLGALIHEKIEKKDWFSEDHAKALQDNSGFEWSEEEAKEIADELQSCVDSGESNHRQDEWKRKAKVAREWNDKISKEEKKIQKQAEAIKGKNVVPMDYPPLLKKKWDDLYKTRSWEDSYPYDTENVKEFIRFLRECGGFRIC